MKRYVLIVAGGKGLRMGGDLPKQFIPVAGKPVLMHTLDVFYQWDASATILLALPEGDQPYWKMVCKELNCVVPHLIVDGGETRFQSVRNGLQQVSGQGLIAVHDGVRPFVAPQVIDACFAEAGRYKAVIPVIPVTESLRESDGEGSRRVRRDHYVIVQTPQVFHTEILKKAYKQPYTADFTDDASVVEASGVTIRTVTGNRENIKITHPFDLLVADAFLSNRT
ncbi:MAG: 2-C-methyl-D-erythritol 4-phosphate cytidylyltransferase [Tannerellaceae bacterium]|jgi:2-C-methyl-D-erythritol 4-phosphate cytidylyltransferase|nr:2-C-methyl-D-erythritol 4-phosphate cytidylyltransferase [Tannerellaceae bacterium]